MTHPLECIGDRTFQLLKTMYQFMSVKSTFENAKFKFLVSFFEVVCSSTIKILYLI